MADVYVPNSNVMIRTLASRPESVVLTPDCLVGISDLSQPEGQRGRKAKLSTLARYAVPPLTVVQGVAEVEVDMISGGFAVTSLDPGAVVHFASLLSMAGQAVPIVNASAHELMLSSSPDEPFRIPGFPAGSTVLLPPWGYAEFRPVITGDVATQGWYPQAGFATQGPRGPQGPPGSPGLKGDKGDPGLQGVPGPRGVGNSRFASSTLTPTVLGLNVATTVKLTWPTPFEDTAYGVSHEVFKPAALPISLGVYLIEKKPDSVTFQVTNLGLSLSTTGITLEALGVRP